MKDRSVIVILLMFLVSGLLVAQVGTEPPFVLDLAGELRGNGWTEEEVACFTDAAFALDWQGTEDTDVEIAALALGYFRAESADDQSGEQQARLALELALASRAMAESGFEKIDIARIELEGIRAGLVGGTASDGSGNEFGQRVRQEILSSLQRRMREVATGRLPDEALEAIRRIEELSTPMVTGDDYVPDLPSGRR